MTPAELDALLRSLNWLPIRAAALVLGVGLALKSLVPALDPTLALWIDVVDAQVWPCADYTDPWGSEYYSYYSCGPNKIHEPGGLGDDVALQGSPPMLAIAWALLPGAILPWIVPLLVVAHPWFRTRRAPKLELLKVIGLAALPSCYYAFTATWLWEPDLSWVPTLVSPRFALGLSAVLASLVVALALTRLPGSGRAA